MLKRRNFSTRSPHQAVSSLTVSYRPQPGKTTNPYVTPSSRLPLLDGCKPAAFLRSETTSCGCCSESRLRNNHHLLRIIRLHWLCPAHGRAIFISLFDWLPL